MDKDYATFRGRLKIAMDARDLDGKRLAEELKVRPNSVSAWMGGTLPGGKSLKRIAERLNVDVHWLLTGEHHGRPEATMAERRMGAIRYIMEGDAEIVSAVLDDAQIRAQREEERQRRRKAQGDE